MMIPATVPPSLPPAGAVAVGRAPATAPLNIPLPAIGAEARGKRRAFLTKARADYQRVERALRSGELTALAEEFVTHATSGAAAIALDELRRRLLGAAGELLLYDLEQRRALFALLHPMPAVALDQSDPTNAQDIVLVELLQVGDLPGARRLILSPGPLEISDHAIGKFFERNPRGDLRAAILDGVATASKLRHAQVKERAAKGWGMNLKAGPGAFVALLFADSDAGSSRVYFRCETWVHADEARQTILAPDNEPGERLGEHWLKPVLR